MPGTKSIPVLLQTTYFWFGLNVEPENQFMTGQVRDDEALIQLPLDIISFDDLVSHMKSHVWTPPTGPRSEFDSHYNTEATVKIRVQFANGPARDGTLEIPVTPDNIQAVLSALQQKPCQDFLIVQFTHRPIHDPNNKYEIKYWDTDTSQWELYPEKPIEGKYYHEGPPSAV